MKKIISIFMIALLLLTSIVSAVSFEDKAEKITNQESKLTLFKWYWNLLKDYSKLIKQNRELKAEILYLQENPVIEYKTRTKTRTVIETKYIICEECQMFPACNPNTHQYVDDGKDECNCAVNPRCEEKKPIPIIKPIKPIFILE